MAAKEENWIREASAYEKLYDFSHKRNTFMLVYQLSLSSKLPLHEAQVIKALTHLQRKCPCLRICYGERNGKMWLRFMNKEEIDFQVVKDVEHDEMRDLLQVYPYKSQEGPLWCVRLLLDTERDPLALDEDLPYTSHLFFGIHHGITDGFTMIKKCSAFVKILNDVIGNNPINDKDQIGSLVSGQETEKIVIAKMAAIQQDPSLMQQLKSRAEEKGMGCPLLFKIEPPPGGEDKTKVITKVLDQEKTKKFIGRCKTNGVSLNSGFSAVANTVNVAYLAENNYIEDPYKVCNGHMVNLRRYGPTDWEDILGCFIFPPINLWFDVPKNVNTNFWDFARNLHQNLHHHLKTEYIFLLEAYARLSSSGEVNYEDIFYSPNPMQIDCTFSNLGDITHHFESNGPHVKSYFLGRHTAIHNTNTQQFVYFVHTLRGRLIVNLLYNTKYSTKNFAQKNCNQLFDMMEQVINGSIY